eukprot:COSAG04_NODE_488_length_13495_cov_24.281257_12_plen_377_part_00
MLPLLSLLASTVPTGAGEAPPASPRRLSVAYYGAPNSNVSAADAAFFKSVGVTDAWTPYLAGAWPVDCCDCRRPGHESKSCATDAKGGAAVYAKEGLHGGLVSLQQAKDERLVETYQAAGINTWFFERPVPDYQWTGAAGTIGKGLWNNSDEIDASWAALAVNISTVYPQVKAMGFAGLVYDNEGYYSKTCKDPGPVSCLWHERSAFDKTVGGKLVRGNYYKRGKQVGAAIAAAWPNAQVIMVYGFPYPGLVQWAQGHIDAGVRVQIGTEHTCKCSRSLCVFFRSLKEAAAHRRRWPLLRAVLHRLVVPMRVRRPGRAPPPRSGAGHGGEAVATVRLGGRAHDRRHRTASARRVWAPGAAVPFAVPRAAAALGSLR